MCVTVYTLTDFVTIYKYSLTITCIVHQVRPLIWILDWANIQCDFRETANFITINTHYYYHLSLHITYQPYLAPKLHNWYVCVYIQIKGQTAKSNLTHYTVKVYTWNLEALDC